MWQWLKRIVRRSDLELTPPGPYREGLEWGHRRRGYIHDHPHNALPYQPGTKEALEWMAGYHAGRGDGP